MRRYIDADALINKLDERCDAICQWTKKEREVMCGACPLATAFDEVEEFPTADVVEVVHGDWIDKGEEYMVRWTCSNCGRRDTHIYDFCPDCGADMRGETDEQGV